MYFDYPAKPRIVASFRRLSVCNRKSIENPARRTVAEVASGSSKGGEAGDPPCPFLCDTTFTPFTTFAGPGSRKCLSGPALASCHAARWTASLRHRWDKGGEGGEARAWDKGEQFTDPRRGTLIDQVHASNSAQ